MTARKDLRKGEAPIAATSMDYRPRSYFCVGDEDTKVMTRVKGTSRRRLAAEYLEIGRELPGFLMAPSLLDADRELIGSWHPKNMGGEYLAAPTANAVEIARISIHSVTGDVTSVYAHEAAGRIVYNMVDEYDGETLNQPTTRVSDEPLTMKELVAFFLGAWDLCGCIEANLEGGLIEPLDFFWAESSFYPYLDATLRLIVAARFPSDEDDAEAD